MITRAFRCDTISVVQSSVYILRSGLYAIHDSSLDIQAGVQLKSTKVCMVVKNQLWNDARVKKEAITLMEAGFDLTIICKPEGDRPLEETWRGMRILRPRKDSASRDALRSRVIAVSDGDGQRFSARLMKSLRRNRLRRFFTDLKRDLPWERKLFRAALATGADIFHANDLDTLLICTKAAKKLGAKLVYDSHELWLESARYLSETSALNRLRYRLTERKLIGRADAVIAVTPSRGEAMERMYPAIHGRVTIIENSTDPIDELPPGGFLRGRLGIPEETPIMLYQGIICPERGLEELLHAASVLRSDENVAIVIVGHDAWGGRLHRLHAELHLEERVFLVPPVPSEELPGVTVSADAGLILFQNTCLNHYYSLPNKLYEYMMAGIAVIASDLPEMGRVIGETGCGILIDEPVPEKIAAAIREMISSPDRMKRMGVLGRTAALDRYNWTTQAGKLITLYRGLS